MTTKITNSKGVKIYDTTSQTRITFIDRPVDSPRADIFKCTLHWQDDSTLLIAWADHIKVARIRARPRTPTAPTSSANLSPLIVEITAVFQLDCMISGIVPHPTPSPRTLDPLPATAKVTPALTAFLILAYNPPDKSFLTGNEATEDRSEQARKAAERPDLRIISRAGEELTADALGIAGFERWGCNDYVLIEVGTGVGGENDRYYVVLSPQDLVVVKPRDWKDHVNWLVERERYEEALEELERRTELQGDNEGDNAIDAVKIGQRYIEHLVNEGQCRINVAYVSSY